MENSQSYKVFPEETFLKVAANISAYVCDAIYLLSPYQQIQKTTFTG